jgi:hypothetical protein
METIIDSNFETKTSNKSSWQPSRPKEKLYSSDVVINAYIQGKQEGLEQAQKAIFEQLKLNILTSENDTLEIINYLQRKSFNPISAHLKLTSWDVLEVLITLPENEFVNNKVLQVYDYIEKYENKINKDMYCLTFNLTDYSDKLDEKSLVSDGYLFKYAIK